MNKDLNAFSINLISYEGFNCENLQLNCLSHCKSNKFRPQNEMI
jgi:hypothetical protein